MMARIGDPVGESQSEILDGEALTTCMSGFVEVYISCLGVLATDRELKWFPKYLI